MILIWMILFTCSLAAQKLSKISISATKIKSMSPFGEHSILCWLGSVFFFVCNIVHVRAYVLVWGKEGTAVLQNQALNRNKASAQRIFPFWSVCDAAGREGGGPEDCGGTAARSGRVNPSLCFGGRPACLQLCFLRPCEGSQAGLSQRSSRWRGAAPSTLLTCQSAENKAALEEKNVQYSRGEVFCCCFLLFCFLFSSPQFF